MNIAIVDDDNNILKTLNQFIHTISEKESFAVSVDLFHDGEELLKNYRPVYDVIFLDIEMKFVNGLDAAREIRKTDQNTLLIFITQMKQYVLHGYQVDALDYIVKPVNYYSFELVFHKILRRLKPRRGKIISLNTKKGTEYISIQDLYYIDVLDHYLTYHTTHGEYRVKGTLGSVEKSLAGCGFIKCSRCCLVNIQYITEIHQNHLVINGHSIEFGRLKRKELLCAIAKYRGGTGI